MSTALTSTLVGARCQPPRSALGVGVEASVGSTVSIRSVSDRQADAWLELSTARVWKSSTPRSVIVVGVPLGTSKTAPAMPNRHCMVTGGLSASMPWRVTT